MLEVEDLHDDGELATHAEQGVSAAISVVRATLPQLHSIVDEHRLDEDGSLSTCLSALRDRIASNEIRLVVLGEFSSGKSTFVDSLLHTNLLRTGILPTTSVCTTIRYGLEPQCQVLLNSGSLARIGLDEIGLFAADGPRGDEASEIQLQIPSPSLAKGLIVVDTPGVNVNIAEHESKTASAIEGANACVYLMDARQPGKKTTIDFIRRIRPRIDKFFFVLNRGDILDANEQKEALQYVKDALINECGIQNPRVELLSSLQFSSGIWATRFQVFKGNLQEFMTNERDSLISAELARLLDRAIARSEYLLESKFRLAEQELAEHYRTSIPDAKRIADSLKHQVRSLVVADIGHAQLSFKEFQKSLCTDLRKEVDRCIESPFTIDTLVNAVPTQIAKAFEVHATQLDQFTEKLLRTIFTVRQQQVGAAVRDIFSHVKWLDQRALLSRVGVWVSGVIGAALLWLIEYGSDAPHGCLVMAPVLGATAATVAYGIYCWAVNLSLFSPATLSIPAYSGHVKSAICGGSLFGQAASTAEIEVTTAPMHIGRAAGAIAGNPWLAVVGAAVSGTIYGSQYGLRVLWDKLSGKLGKLRAEIRNNVEPVLKEFESESIRGGFEAIKSGEDSAISSLHEVIDTSLQRYQAILDRLLKPHRRIRTMLEKRRNRLHDDVVHLRGSRQAVVESLQSLERELKGTFSSHLPEFQDLDHSQVSSVVVSGEGSMIPILRSDVIDFRSGESRSFESAAERDSSRSSSTRQPLVLAWTFCLLICIALTVASLKLAGALPSFAHSRGELEPIVPSASTTGAEQVARNAPTANQELRPTALATPGSDDNPPSTAEPQGSLGAQGENATSDSTATPLGNQQENPTSTGTGSSSVAETSIDVSSPHAARELNSQALRLLALNPPDLMGARSALESAARLAPSDLEIQNNLGDVYGRMGEYRTADRLLSWVVSVDPMRRVAQGNLGYVEAKLGKVADASKHFCQYVRLSKSSEQGKATLARVMNDPDLNVQTAVNLAETNCIQ